MRKNRSFSSQTIRKGKKVGKIYYYKLTVDDGGAPCVQSEILSLAICKPRIRTGANEGDWVFGFAANSLDSNNRLIYIAQVTDKKRGGEYYRSSEYAGRADRIYRSLGDEYAWRPRARYHGKPGDLQRDLGRPPRYPRAQVLLSSEFRYFGSSGTSAYKTKFPYVKNAVEKLGQGERVNHPDMLRNELMRLKLESWRRFRDKVCGDPHQPPDVTACHRARSFGEC